MNGHSLTGSEVAAAAEWLRPVSIINLSGVVN